MTLSPQNSGKANPRVLVTGATGLIGRHALQPLAEAGYEIHALTSGAPDDAARSIGLDGVRWYRHDLLGSEGLQELMAVTRPSHLLHNAWQVEGWAKTGEEINRRWYDASIALLQSFVDAGGTRAVMVGTCTEYDWTQGACSEFKTPRRPMTPYGTFKDRLSDKLGEISEKAGVSHAWGRVFFLFGPHQPANRLVPSVIISLLKGEHADCSSGEQRRDFLHVRDVGAALSAILDSDVSGPVNVGSGSAPAVKEVVTTLSRLIDTGGRVRLGAFSGPAEEPLVLADVQRLKTEVGFTPMYDLEGGLLDTIDWWRARVTDARATS